MTLEASGGAMPRPKSRRSVSLLAWGYNEEGLIEGFFDRAFALLETAAEDYELVFVDDGSTDRTGAIADAYAARNPRLRVIHNEQNVNVGMSCRRAVLAARKEILFWQTVDWSYDLTELPIFLVLLDKYDVVQGIRPAPIRLLSYIPVLRSIWRVRTRSDNFRKAIVSLTNYYLLRILFGAPFHDFQNVTFYRASLAQGFAMQARSSFVNPEFLLRAYWSGARFIEVPIPFIRRQSGVAKGTKLTSILRSIRDIFLGFVTWGWRFRLQTWGKAGRGLTARIHRVAEPFWLDDDVLRQVLPLLRYFR